MKKIALGAVCIISISLLLGSNAAYAGEILQMDLSGGSSTSANTFTFTNGVFVLTATAHDNVPNSADVHQDTDGLGVQTLSNSDPNVDGTDGFTGPTSDKVWETLILTMNKEVKLLEVTFENAGNNDEYSLSVDGVFVKVGDLGATGGTIQSFDAIGTEFAFSPTDVTDTYKVLSIKFESLNDDQVIGGERIPIETTSLILAGAESTSWLIPVVLSMIGIGLVFVKRQK